VESVIAKREFISIVVEQLSLGLQHRQ